MDFAHSFPLQDPIKTFKIFTNNGFVLNGIELPEEMVLIILSYVDFANILECSLVCKLWNNIIKSFPLWSTIYQRKYNRKCKQLPCHAAFKSVERFPLNDGILDKIKTLPVISVGTDLNPAMYNHCENTFTKEMWLITVPTRKLFQYIIDKYQPAIYVTNCGGVSRLQRGIFRTEIDTHLASIDNRPGLEFLLAKVAYYNNMELFIKPYPVGIRGIVIQSNKYGIPISLLANPIVSFSFESIKEEVDEIARDESVIRCIWTIATK